MTGGPAGCIDACFHDDLSDLAFSIRGWSVRHGRRRRLKAILSDSIGDDCVVCRGRSVFKRSAFQGKHFRSRGRQRIARSRCPATADDWQNSRNWASSASSWLAELQSGVLAETDAEFSSVWPAWCDKEEKTDIDVAPVQDIAEDACSTCPSTVASSEDVFLGAASTKTGFMDPCTTSLEAEATPSRWEMAVRRAEAVAGSYITTKVNSTKRKAKKQVKPLTEHQEFLLRLQQTYHIRVFDDAAECSDKPRSNFEDFRWEFFKYHADNLCQNLRQVFGEDHILQISATPLDASVGNAFYTACHGGMPGTLVPAVHGTHERHLDSIYSHGLLVPDKSNHVRVANGSVHGVGIYAAHVSNLGMCLSYARGVDPPLLFCGVLESMADTDMLNIGSFRVVFDSRRIVPLFVVQRSSVPVAPKPMLNNTKHLLSSAKIAEILSRGDSHTQASRHRGSRKHKGSPARLVGVVAFLARRAARKRLGPRAIHSRQHT